MSEQWTLTIRPGDTPESVAAVAEAHAKRLAERVAELEAQGDRQPWVGDYYAETKRLEAHLQQAQARQAKLEESLGDSHHKYEAQRDIVRVIEHRLQQATEALREIANAPQLEQLRAEWAGARNIARDALAALALPPDAHAIAGEDDG